MNIKIRLKNLEANNANKPTCFCGKTLLDLWYGKHGESVLTYCPNCKDQFNHLQKMTAEARKCENLTDKVSI